MCTHLVVFGQALRTAGGSGLDLTLKSRHENDVTDEDIQQYLKCVTRSDDSSTVARPTERSAMKVSSVSPLHKEKIHKRNRLNWNVKY